ncbi:hypothetical protein BX666DRAFT_382517 [Dichotomocladium elegans]|nr:hypothetical protein BX666DRAFT_382517 [Dichotomocladium elegans]
MDIFGRSKAKGKRRPEPITSSSRNVSGSLYSSSPPSPSAHPSLHSSTTTSSTSIEDYFSGHGGGGEGSSSRSSQSTTNTYSYMSSTDSVNEMLLMGASNPDSLTDALTDAEIEASFEKMLTRRGIHDPAARSKMGSFSIDKKRLMVVQDIQAEAGASLGSTPATSRRGVLSDKDASEKKGPEYYVKKLSEPDPKGIPPKILAHLGVSLRTMPLRYHL